MKNQASLIMTDFLILVSLFLAAVEYLCLRLTTTVIWLNLAAMAGAWPF
jgi:hypothetical protein